MNIWFFLKLAGWHWSLNIIVRFITKQFTVIENIQVIVTKKQVKEVLLIHSQALVSFSSPVLNYSLTVLLYLASYEV